MWKFYKLIDLTTYFYLSTHLLVHFIKIKTNRWLITTLNSIDIKVLNEQNINSYFNGFLWGVVLWNIGNILLNFINRFTNYKIKNFLAKISKNYYLDNLSNQDNKNSLHLFESSLVLDRIYERLLFTIPKILIYVFYYLYSLVNFSYSILFITFIFNVVGVFITRKINKFKKKIFTDIHNIEIDIKNEHINFVKNKENNDNDKDKDKKNLEHLYNYRNLEKDKEIKFIHLSSITNELFTDILLGTVYCIGFRYLYEESHLKPIELMYMGVNSSNFLNFIIEIIDSYHQHNLDLVHIVNNF
jgi:hypothetical protein